MFSGIIEEAATIAKAPNGKLVVSSRLDHSKTNIGDSIALDGCCLTVVSKTVGGELTFDVSEETYRRTTLGSLKAGDKVNLERSLEVGSRIHGHFVMGHIDTVVKLLGREREFNSERFTWELPTPLKRFVREKGSIAISGISLTVGEVTHNTFNVYIIPHTNAVTNLDAKKVGSLVNVEVDVLARYVVNEEPKGVSESLLRDHGYLNE